MRKTPVCRVCGGKGHNRKSCHGQKQLDLLAQTQVRSNAHYDEDEEDDFECELFANVDMVRVILGVEYLCVHTVLIFLAIYLMIFV